MLSIISGRTSAKSHEEHLSNFCKKLQVHPRKLSKKIGGIFAGITEDVSQRIEEEFVAFVKIILEEF